MKWLNNIGAQILSVQHAIGGAERNFSTHSFIFSVRRQTLAATTLQRYVRIFVNQRLRDRVKRRGVKAKRTSEAEPKPYPLEGADWSSCDESEDDSQDLTVPATMGFGATAPRVRCDGRARDLLCMVT